MPRITRRDAIYAGALFIAGCTEARPPPARLYQGVNLSEGVVYVSSRRFKTHGLEWLDQRAGAVSLQPMSTAPLRASAEILILIHGYASRDAQVASYFDEFVAQLRDETYAAPIVVYDWPSTARHFEELSVAEQDGYTSLVADESGRVHGLPPHLRWELMQYGVDGRAAATIGVDGLIALLGALRAVNPEASLKIVAHSMGGRIPVAAMVREPDLSARLANVVLLASDLAAGVFDEAKTRAAVAKLGRCDVFYSRRDEALKFYATIARFGPRLGVDGPARPGALPANVGVHDVTNALGEGDAHMKYVARAGAAALGLGALLMAAPGP